MLQSRRMMSEKKVKAWCCGCRASAGRIAEAAPPSLKSSAQRRPAAFEKDRDRCERGRHGCGPLPSTIRAAILISRSRKVANSEVLNEERLGAALRIASKGNRRRCEGSTELIGSWALSTWRVIKGEGWLLCPPMRFSAVPMLWVVS